MKMAQIAEKKQVKAAPVLRNYVRAALRYPLLLACLFIGVVTIEVAGVVAPLYLRTFINNVAGGHPSSVLTSILLATLIAYGITQLVGWLGRRIQMASLQYIEVRAMRDLYDDAFSALIKHSSDFFNSNFAGSLQRRVSRYSKSFEDILDIYTFNYFSTAIFAVGAIGILATRNVWLGLILLLWTLLFIWVQIAMAKWRQPLRLARSAEDSAVTGVLSDAISNQSAISLFASRDHERSLLQTAVGKWYVATVKSWNADLWIYSVQGLLAIAIELILLAGAVFLFNHGLVTVGDFVLIQVYVLGLIERVWNIGGSMRRLYDAFADAHEMVVIMETPYTIADAKDATALNVSKGEISFTDVLFRFNDLRTILSDFNLQIPAGQKVALVGPSGAGKSTVTKLLLRLFDVNEGSILIDGQDIKSVTQDSLHEAVSYVPQEPALFHRTLKDNIRYGRLSATDEEVIDAAKQAHCHEFIAGLAEGYDTFVGERGVKLSGGERQRVAIARAILKNAPILVLDEATSALDSESEHLIQDALQTLMRGKTVIVIAHRLSTIMKMDRIVVIEDGRIVSDGTHDELLSQESNLYKKLWSIQAGSFITETE